ncbi:hypothetical protein CC78DRAFT_543520 [Lojkania enalia]|uniref:Rhodopsin domain-containing protein n=1 Tax=Lojkania enalia TaxID=147567 RepID=A0A9P4KBM2_9PLEO|nr:hypothetical protein CC78DRAFT_543520 [Didymosphaeria enalia]
MAAQDSGLTPLAPPPPGIVPNFEHPASKKKVQIVAMSVIAVITTISVYLRMHAKTIVQRNFDVSDLTLAIGYIVTIGYSYILFDLAVIPGVGNHAYELRLNDIPERYYSLLIASGIIQAVCLLFIKLSLLILIAKMFWVRKWARITIYIGIFITTVAYVVYLILGMYYCVPRPGETAMGILVGIGTARCLNILTLGTFLSAFNAVSDVLILAIAVQIIMTLQTTLSRRIRASSIFFIGLAATIVSILNAYYRIAKNSSDPWDYTLLFTLGYYDITLAMICACLPCLPILGKSATAQRLMQSRLFSTLGRKSPQSGVTITRSFDVENSYELQADGFERLTNQPTR